MQIIRGGPISGTAGTCNGQDNAPPYMSPWQRKLERRNHPALRTTDETVNLSFWPLDETKPIGFGRSLLASSDYVLCGPSKRSIRQSINQSTCQSFSKWPVESRECTKRRDVKNESILPLDSRCICNAYAYRWIFMVALWNRADHYIFIMWFLLLFFLA